jgi:hypothetical protein
VVEQQVLKVLGDLVEVVVHKGLKVQLDLQDM